MIHRAVQTAAALMLTGFMAVGATAVSAADENNDANITLIGTCVACHGADGIGKAPQYPNLAGQKQDYLVKQLKAFRSGERKDSNMEPLAQPLSDQDIAALAAYFSKLD